MAEQHGFPDGIFLLIKDRIILLGCQLQDIVIGQERLQNRTSGGIAPSASADNLRNQGKCPLITAKNRRQTVLGQERARPPA